MLGYHDMGNRTEATMASCEAAAKYGDCSLLRPGCWTTELHPELPPPLLLPFVPGMTPVMLAKMTLAATPTGTFTVRGKKDPAANRESPLTLQ